MVGCETSSCGGQTEGQGRRMLEGHAEAFLVFFSKRNRTPPKGVKPRQTRRVPPDTSPRTLDSGSLSLLIQERGIKTVSLKGNAQRIR